MGKVLLLGKGVILLSIFPNSRGGECYFWDFGGFWVWWVLFFHGKRGGDVFSMWVGIFVLYRVYLGFAVLFGQGRVWFVGSL